MAKDASECVVIIFLFYILYFVSPDFQPLVIFCACTAQLMSELFGTPEDRFSRVAAHIMLLSSSLSLYSLVVQLHTRYIFEIITAHLSQTLKYLDNIFRCFYSEIYEETYKPSRVYDPALSVI